MHVTICGDDPAFVARLREGIEKFCAQHKRICLEVSCFTENEIVDNLATGPHTSLFLLDCDSLREHGIPLTKELRKHLPDSVFVFCCSTKDLAFEAYSLHVQRYLMKPIKQIHLFEALSYLSHYINHIQKKNFGMKSQSGAIKVSHDKILYIESRARTFFVHCKNGKTLQSLSLRNSFEATLESVLLDSRFLQTHKSFIVNLDHVKSMSYPRVVMRNGESIPISQSRYKQVKRDYQKFVGIN